MMICRMSLAISSFCFEPFKERLLSIMQKWFKHLKFFCGEDVDMMNLSSEEFSVTLDECWIWDRWLEQLPRCDVRSNKDAAVRVQGKYA